MTTPQATTPEMSPKKAAAPSGPAPRTVGAMALISCSPTTM